MRKLLPAIRSAAAYVPSEAVDGGFRHSLPCAPVKSFLEGAGSVENNKHLLCQIHGNSFSEQSLEHLPFVMAQLTILKTV